MHVSSPHKNNQTIPFVSISMLLLDFIAAVECFCLRFFPCMEMSTAGMCVGVNPCVRVYVSFGRHM